MTTIHAIQSVVRVDRTSAGNLVRLSDGGRYRSGDLISAAQR